MSDSNIDNIWKDYKTSIPLTPKELKGLGEFIHNEFVKTAISLDEEKKFIETITPCKFSLDPEKRQYSSLQAVMEFVDRVKNQRMSEAKKAKDEAKQSEPIKNTEEEREQAMNILKGDPLKYIDDIQKNIIVGEDCNRKALTLIRSTCYTEKPLSDRNLGSAAVGKSYLENSVALCFPPEDVYIKSRMTPTWIERTKDNLKHKILIVQQTSEEFSGRDALHVQLSEHGTTLSTVDKQGNAVDIKVDSSISFGFTSTNIYVNPQMETRTVLISPDESKEQTERIIKKQLEYAEAPWKEGEDNKALQGIVKIIRWLRDEGIKEVAIPYASCLKIPFERHEMRRINPQITDFIKAAARINQLNRLIATRPDGTRYVLAQYEDAQYVFDNLEPIIGKTVGELTDDDKKILQKLRLLHGSVGEREFNYKHLLNNEVMDEMVFATKTTAKSWLSRMAKYNFVEVTQQGGGKGKANKYRVISLEDDAKPFYTIKASISPSVCETKLKEWIDRYRYTISENSLSLSDGTRQKVSL